LSTECRLHTRGSGYCRGDRHQDDNGITMTSAVTMINRRNPAI
jgi:hypothetical protein